MRGGVRFPQLHNAENTHLPGLLWGWKSNTGAEGLIAESLTRANARSVDGGIWGCPTPSTDSPIEKRQLTVSLVASGPRQGGDRAAGGGEFHWPTQMRRNVIADA